MGGDRDGNPFVTPETTREVVLTARMAAISEYERSVEKLMYELSVWRCNDELQVPPGFKGLSESRAQHGCGIMEISHACALSLYSSLPPSLASSLPVTTSCRCRLTNRLVSLLVEVRLGEAVEQHQTGG